MRKTYFLPVVLFIGLVACNDASTEKKAETGDTTNHSHDTGSHDGHSHGASTSSDIPAVPALPDGAKVYFKNLKDGQTVTSPFKVEMGADNISVDSAIAIKQASGHHHILIGLDSVAAGTIVPKDSTHLHFGNAQKEAELTLAPGKHKISLQFADGIHRSYGGKMSATITVNVKK